MSSRQKLGRLIRIILTELLLVAGICWFFDIFYQYHAPFFGMDAVFNDRDNQMPGSIRTFDYDSALVGSSVAENFDTSGFDEAFGCNTLKIIKSSGTSDDLIYYINMAEENHTLKNVFWCFDLFSVENGNGVQLFNEGAPRYLHTKTVLDDVPYLFNKEILMEKIPTWIISSAEGINTGGNAYNWADGKEFGTEILLSHYSRMYVDENEITMIPEEEYRSLIDDNITEVAQMIESHPETQFDIMLPPYSLFWWDSSWVNGQFEMHMYTMERIFKTLLPIDNVKIFCFQNEREIVLDTGNYMDMIHYSPEINRYMLDSLARGDYEVTEDNLEEALGQMREIMSEIEKTEMPKYYATQE